MPHYQAGGPVFVQLGTEVQIDIPFVNIPAEVAAHIDVAEADFVGEKDLQRKLLNLLEHNPFPHDEIELEMDVE